MGTIHGFMNTKHFKKKMNQVAAHICLGKEIVLDTVENLVKLVTYSYKSTHYHKPVTLADLSSKWIHFGKTQHRLGY